MPLDAGKGPARLHGRRLIYITPDGRQVLAAEIVSSARGLSVAGRRTVAAGEYLANVGPQRMLDAARDGRLAIIKPLPRAANSRAGQIVFLENVVEGLPAASREAVSPR